jgi:hypothetical protein
MEPRSMECLNDAKDQVISTNLHPFACPDMEDSTGIQNWPIFDAACSRQRTGTKIISNMVGEGSKSVSAAPLVFTALLPCKST